MRGHSHLGPLQVISAGVGGASTHRSDFCRGPFCASHKSPGRRVAQFLRRPNQAMIPAELAPVGTHTWDPCQPFFCRGGRCERGGTHTRGPQPRVPWHMEGRAIGAGPRRTRNPPTAARRPQAPRGPRPVARAHGPSVASASHALMGCDAPATRLAVGAAVVGPPSQRHASPMGPTRPTQRRPPLAMPRRGCGPVAPPALPTRPGRRPALACAPLQALGGCPLQSGWLLRVGGSRRRSGYRFSQPHAGTPTGRRQMALHPCPSRRPGGCCHWRRHRRPKD